MDKAAELSAKQISIAVWNRAKSLTSETVNPPTQSNNRLRHNPHIGGNGTPPNYATGNLNRNIIANPVRRLGFSTYAASVTSGAEYARVLEEGSSRWLSGVKYPYMNPARDEIVNTGKARMIVNGFFRAAMGG
jgi:hypothetical protein